MPVPCWPGPWPADIISCFASDLPCLYELAFVIMDLPGNHCSAAWSRLLTPALPRSSKEHLVDEAGAVTLGSSSSEEKPILSDRWVPRCFGNCIRKQYYRVLKSQPTKRNQCWLFTLYHKISPKVLFTIVLLIFCANQHTFLNKLVIQQNTLSRIYMSSCPFLNVIAVL